MLSTRFSLPFALAAAVLLSAAPTCFAGSVERLPLVDGDLSPAVLVQPLEPKGLPEASREPVAFSWPLPTDQELDLAVRPTVAASREYWLAVTAADLQRGVALDTTSAGALVRVNPAARADAETGFAIDPANLVLVTAEGRELAAGTGMELLVTAEQLDAADAPFPEGTSAFRISSDLGAGTFTLRAPDLPPPTETRYVVHVFEPTSDALLELSTTTDTVFSGDTMTAHAVLRAGERQLRLDGVTGLVVSPAGQATPIRFASTSRGSASAAFPVSSLAVSEGLWEVQVTATGRQGELTVRRTVRTAFALSVPTARLTGTVEAGRGVSVRFQVEAAVAGRYEVRGILYGTGPDRVLRPLAVAQSAAWLEPGLSFLELPVDQAVAEATLGPPYELRDLRLVDQGRMGLLHRQNRALRILP